MTRSPLLLLFCVLVVTGCTSLPDSGEVPVFAQGNTIWLVYRDWHTSVLIDGDDFWRLSRQAHQNQRLEAEVSTARAVRVGWGDGDYFTGKSKSAGTATRALFASGYSALQFIGYESDPLPSIDAETRVPLVIGDDGLAAMIAYVDASLATDDVGELQPLPSYVERAGVFFESSSHYGLFNNCNSWTGEALRTAGLPIRGALHLTPSGIFEQARAIAAIQAAHTPEVAGP